MSIDIAANELQVAVIQHHCLSEIAANQSHIEESIQRAAQLGARLIVLQELHNSTYFCQQEHPRFFDIAETIPGDSTRWLGSLAQLHQLVIVASLFEKRLAGVYHNTAVVFETDGSIAGLYRKMHIPDDPGYYEKYYFTPGDQGFVPIDTSVGRLGVQVCWDQWFPEGARINALAGAQLLIYPSAIGWEPSDTDAEKQRQLDAWITVQRAHAITNGIPVISSNRQGTEQGDDGQRIDFWGHSFVCDSFGTVMAMASADQDEILMATVNLNESESTRRLWPFLRDRRIDAYQQLKQRTID